MVVIALVFSCRNAWPGFAQPDPMLVSSSLLTSSDVYANFRTRLGLRVIHHGSRAAGGNSSRCQSCRCHRFGKLDLNNHKFLQMADMASVDEVEDGQIAQVVRRIGLQEPEYLGS